VTRATTSILVALVLVLVLLGGPCLACATAIVGGVNHNCCHPKKGCQEHPSGPLGDCVSPTVDLAKVEQASARVFVSPSVLDQPWNSDVQPQQIDTDYAPPDPVLHSPPELYLLNSVLTI
jgi:hypothetical protein